MINSQTITMEPRDALPIVHTNVQNRCGILLKRFKVINEPNPRLFLAFRAK